VRNGADAVLSWTAATGAIGYHIFRDTAPYFTPGSPYTTTATLSFADPGVIGDPAINYYYVVAAFNEAGETSCANRAGAFDVALTPGTPGEFALQDIAYPLDASPTITDAESLAASIGDSVQQVRKWDATTQSFIAWSHVFQFGDRFATTVGDYYDLVLDETAPPLAGFVGLVPEPGSVSFALVGGSAGQCNFNFLSLPLDRATITSADQLADNIGTPNPPGPPTALQALDWNAPLETFLAWSNEFNFGDNFSTRIGYPYVVCLSDTGVPIQWP
jgi:hypothetical protein